MEDFFKLEIGHEIVGKVLPKPVLYSSNYGTSSYTGLHCEGKWATDGHWLLLVGVGGGLEKLETAGRQMEDKTLQDLIPSEPYKILGQPTETGVSFIAGSIYIWKLDEFELFVKCKYYNWIRKTLGLKLAIPETAGKPIPILDVADEAVGCVMPVGQTEVLTERRELLTGEKR